MLHRLYLPTRLSLALSVVLFALTSCSQNPAPATTPEEQANSSSANAERARVLVLQSPQSPDAWRQELEQGVRDGLATSGYDVTAGNLILDVYWMHSEDADNSASQDELAASAQQYIVETKPDVVIAAGDSAIQWVVARWSDDTVAFVYTGLNGMPENYNLVDRPNITGVLERVHLKESLDWIKLVIPEAGKLMFLSDDSATSDAYLGELQTQLSMSPDFRGSKTYRTNSFTDWKVLVEIANSTSDVILVGTYQTLRDEFGNAMSQSEVMQWTVQNADIPVVPLWEFGVRDGALGGSVISGKIQGYEAALKAARILQGEAPGDIGITIPQRGELVVNAEAVRRWQIDFPVDLLEVSTVYGPDGRLASR